MHYKDGTEAKAGDLVKGTCYNTKGVIVGIVLGITPGSSSCNCRVAITRIVHSDDIPVGRSPGTRGGDDPGSPWISGVITSDGYAMPHREADPSLRIADSVMVGLRVDYSQCDHFELVHRDGYVRPVADAGGDPVLRGQKAYAAYSAAAGGVTFDGKPLPSWDELGENRQFCWIAAAQGEAYLTPVPTA